MDEEGFGCFANITVAGKVTVQRFHHVGRVLFIILYQTADRQRIKLGGFFIFHSAAKQLIDDEVLVKMHPCHAAQIAGDPDSLLRLGKAAAHIDKTGGRLPHTDIEDILLCDGMQTVVKPLDKPPIFLTNALVRFGMGNAQKGDNKAATMNRDAAAALLAGKFPDLGDHTVLDAQEGILHSFRSRGRRCPA